MCRTAECAGADGLVIPPTSRGRGDARRLQGLSGRCRAPRGGRVRNLADFLIEARDAGCWSYGASAPEQTESEGARAPIPYDSPDYRGSGVILVLGSEGSGLRPRVAGACDELIALPLRGRVAR